MSLNWHFRNAQRPELFKFATTAKFMTKTKEL